MCGIFGILDLEGHLDLAPEVLRRMGKVLEHRGPDDSGSYRDDCVYLGHKRLSIIDLKSGKQPIFNEVSWQRQSVRVTATRECQGESSRDRFGYLVMGP